MKRAKVILGVRVTILRWLSVKAEGAFVTEHTCQLLTELFGSAKQTNRNYWIMTELFCALHGGRDFCAHKGADPKPVNECVLCDKEVSHAKCYPPGSEGVLIVGETREQVKEFEDYVDRGL